ncbi:MAG: molybdate ABC transporter substrate-binding protein [Gammaproteobacteria bacterium]|nr:MAG: molybdate ABC transporter substrate-binding protein [Gammaproteobacteria bacterium]
MRAPPAAWLLALLFAAVPAAGAEALIAVAANFLQPARALVTDFTKASGHHIELSGGSTGKLYAQVLNGAPYDALLAADQRRAAALEAAGIAVPGSRFIYARGRLLLWSAEPALREAELIERLRAGRFRKLAIANPELAPYGAAAREALRRLGLWEQLATRIVRGENVAQAYAMAASGAAELAFIAASLQPRSGGAWLVPETLHEPIHQDAVLLRHGAGNPAARAFLDWLRSPAARQRLQAYGYAVD